MKIVTIIGARPQFIKAASLSREVLNNKEIDEVIVHTGQHYDANMSDVFFEEMGIPKPKYNLNINSLDHGAMTGKMLEEIEKLLKIENPDWLLVYGDTNSTLAGALAAKKMHIKLAHVEAGLRSFNMEMPEEVNRILTDRISDILFCPTEQALNNLEKEGYNNFDSKKINVGDIMYDSALYYSSLENKNNFSSPYVLCTIHRAENTNSKEKLTKIFKGLDEINKVYKVVLPLHPRTKKYLKEYGINTNVKLIDPLGYLDMVNYIKNSLAVITDSGGLQKEAYFFNKKCFTFRDETEWVELIQAKCNYLVNVLDDDISSLVLENIDKDIQFPKNIYGEGNTSKLIIQELLNYE